MTSPFQPAGFAQGVTSRAAFAVFSPVADTELCTGWVWCPSGADATNWLNFDVLRPSVVFSYVHLIVFVDFLFDFLCSCFYDHDPLAMHIARSKTPVSMPATAVDISFLAGRARHAVVAIGPVRGTCGGNSGSCLCCSLVHFAFGTTPVYQAISPVKLEVVQSFSAMPPSRRWGRDTMAAPTR